MAGCGGRVLGGGWWGMGGRESRRTWAVASVLSRVSVLDEARVDEISRSARPPACRVAVPTPGNPSAAIASPAASSSSSDELDDSDDGDAVKYASSSTDAVEIDRS